MGFRNEAYAKVWEVRPNQSGRSTSVRLSISKKVGDGQYEDDFSGWVTFIATANDRAGGLKSGDRIKLGDTDVSSKYNRDKKESAYSFKVFSFEPAEGARNTPKKKGSTLDAVEDGDLPDDFPA
jgi:hypothetical protein